MLGWSQQQLAERSGVGRRTVAEFEKGGERVSEPSIAAMREALELAGIRFTSAAGNEGVERTLR
jgi:transcriptional regulator with XRE-family HTH domain